MAEFSSPGHYYSDGDPVAISVTGANVGRCALIGPTEMGPVDRPVVCVGWADYLRRFGGAVPGSFVPYAAHSIWRQYPNAEIVIQRAVHFTDPTDKSTATAVAAAYVLVDRQATPADTLSIEALTPGAWGNGLTVTVEDDGTNAFRLIVKLKGVVKETWRNLVMDASSERYAPLVINGNSWYIRVADEQSPAADAQKLPKLGTNALAGGNDGDAITDADIQGDPMAGTGIYGFDLFDDTGLLIGAPGFTSRSVAEALCNYASSRFDSYVVLDPPEGADAAAINEHVDTTLALNTDWAGLYWPRLWYSDPFGGGQKLIPPSGFVMGAFARTDATPGLGPWQVAGGVEYGRLNGVMGFEVEDVNRKPIRDLVYPHRVNPIYAHRTYGACILGSKTLATSGKQLLHANQRRMESYIAKSLDISTQWVLMQNNDQSLWKRLNRSIRGFLVRVWKAGGLKGETPEQAFAIKIDQDNNPPGQEEVVQVDIGLAHQTPGQFVWFRFSQHTLGSDLEKAASVGAAPEGGSAPVGGAVEA